MDRYIIKFTWKVKLTKVAKIILKEKHKTGGITLLEFETV